MTRVVTLATVYLADGWKSHDCRSLISDLQRCLPWAELVTLTAWQMCTSASELYLLLYDQLTRAQRGLDLLAVNNIIFSII